MLDIEKFGQGALHERDDRDFLAMGAGELYDWSKPYVFDVPLKVTDQGKSMSCVGQSAMNMAKILHYKHRGSLKDFSARYVYSQIFLPSGNGAYMRDGVDVVVKQGVALNSSCPSIPNDEADMRIKPSDDARKEAAAYDIYKDNKYALVPNMTIDGIARAIVDHGCVMLGFNGSNEGWRDEDGVIKVSGSVWGHAVCATAPVIRNGKKYIQFINSWTDKWGDNGYGYADEEVIEKMLITAFVITDSYVNPIKDRAMAYIAQNPNKLVQNVSTGQIGIIVGDTVKVTTPERAGLLALTYLLRNGGGGGVPDELWNGFKKDIF